MKESVKNILRQAGQGARIDLIEKGFCPTCKQRVNINLLKTPKSKKIFEDTGMCIDCQKK